MLGLDDIKGLKGETEETDSPIETRTLAAILLGGRRQRRRLRRMLVKELVGSMTEGDEDEGDTDDTERTLVRLLIGGRAHRRARLRRALVAHVLSTKGQTLDTDDEDDDDTGIFETNGNGDGGDLLKALAGGRAIKRNRMRKMLTAKLLRGATDEDDDDDDDISEGDVTQRQLIGLLLGRGAQRRKMRRFVLAKLLNDVA